MSIKTQSPRASARRDPIAWCFALGVLLSLGVGCGSSSTTGTGDTSGSVDIVDRADSDSSKGADVSPDASLADLVEDLLAPDPIDLVEDLLAPDPNGDDGADDQSGDGNAGSEDGTSDDVGDAGGMNDADTLPPSDTISDDTSAGDDSSSSDAVPSDTTPKDDASASDATTGEDSSSSDASTDDGSETDATPSDDLATGDAIATIPALLYDLKAISDVATWKSSCTKNCATMLWLPLEVADSKAVDAAIRAYISNVVGVKPGSISSSAQSCGAAQKQSCTNLFDAAVLATDGCHAPLLKPTAASIEANASDIRLALYTPKDGNVSLPHVVSIAGIYQGRAMALLFFNGVTECKVLDVDALKLSVDAAPTAEPMSGSCSSQTSPSSCVEMLWPAIFGSRAADIPSVIEKYLSGKSGIKSTSVDVTFSCPEVECQNAFDQGVFEFDMCMANNLRNMVHFLRFALETALASSYTLTSATETSKAVTFSGVFLGQIVSIIVYEDPNICE
ncbi:MAG: hypothetical protein KC609_22230 [Myxococcales bacterium]|nr:hypothetical protein [Myxococcales bacterium]